MTGQKAEIAPCPVCGHPLVHINEPRRNILVCDACGWLKSFLTGSQMGGDPRYGIAPRAGVSVPESAP